MPRRVRFPHSPSDAPLALEPSAAGLFFDFFDDSEPFAPVDCGEDGIAVLTIEGPLSQRAGWFDGYDAIESRFREALATKPRAIILRINSPGGECAGCFEAVRSMRSAARAAKVPVIAFADEVAYSAAYALATVASEVYLPESGGLGSIGVIQELIDQTRRNEAEGFRVAVIRSGSEKADGHPDIPLSEEIITRAQERVDSLAELFAEVVAEGRGGSARKWLKLNAGVRYGAEAVKAGLADGVLPWRGLRESVVKTLGLPTETIALRLWGESILTRGSSVTHPSQRRSQRPLAERPQ